MLIFPLKKEFGDVTLKFCENEMTQKFKELKEENEELKKRHAEILEAFTSASSGDDFEMAESAREIMEILNIPCYRHGKVVSKLTKAKEFLKKIEKIVYSGENELKRLAKISDILAEAEQFLKEVEK